MKKFLLLFAVVYFIVMPLYALTTNEKLVIEDQRLIEQREQIEKERRELLKMQQEIERTRKQKRFEPEKKKIIEVPLKEAEVFVKDIVVEGVKKISPKKINKIINSYKNKKLKKSDIVNIQTELQNLYLEKGYISSRIYLNVDSLNDGILKFTAEEGFVESIGFADPKQGKLPIIMAFPFLKGRILNIRDIEQGLEQINNLTSNNAAMNVKPAKEPGGSYVEILNTPTRRTRMMFGVDNAGTEPNEYRGLTTFQADNLFRLNDSLNLQYSQGIEDDEYGDFYSKNYAASLKFPFGYWTFNFSYSQSLYLNTIQGIYSKIKSSGGSENYTGNIDRTLFRGQRYKINFGFDLTQKESNNFYDDIKLDVNSRRLAVADAYISNTLYIKNGFLFTKLSYIKGLDILEALKDADDLTDGQPKAQYEAYNFTGSLLKSFNIPKTMFPLSYRMSFSSKYSDYDLFGTEQFTPDIRGFKEGAISGETGFSIKNDIEFKLIKTMPFIKNKFITKMLAGISVGCFYDIGRISHKTYGRDETISGWGYGMNGNITEYFSFSASISNSIEVPESLEKEKNVFDMNVNITVPLF
jgi:hemolysin activation/secretion protein